MTTLQDGAVAGRLPLGVITISALLAATIFAFDLSLPLGIAGGVPYVALVLVGLWFPVPWAMLVLGGVGSVLTVAGYIWSEPASVPWMVLVNRALALFAIWIVAILGYQRRRVEIALAHSHDHLEDRIRKRTAALGESEERLKEAERAALLGHWQMDFGTGQLLRSDQGIRNYGLEVGQMAPTFEEFLQSVHPDDRDMVKARAEKALSTLEPDQYEFRTLWPDGQVRTILAKNQMVLGDDGSLVRMLGTNQDITERKRLEQQLVQSERLTTLGKLTGTVAHELRNPLATIATTLEIVDRKTAETQPDLHATLERAKRSIKRCDNIITELLDYARAKGPQAQAIELNQWLAQTLDEISLPDNITLRREFDPEIGAVEIDPDQIFQVIANLVDNAVQAMQGEAHEDRAGAEHLLTVSSRMIDAGLEISVADDGPGIPTDIRSRVIEPLFSTKSFGIGLGLSIVQQIVEAHGGGLEIESQDGRGTEVTFSIPVDGPLQRGNVS